MGKWETCFWFSTFPSLRRRPVGNVGIAERFPRAVESGVCFPSVRHFHRRFLFGCGFSFRFLGLLDAVARDVQFENDAVMHQAINGGGGRHWVFEDAFPFGKRQIAGDQHTAAFVALGQ